MQAVFIPPVFYLFQLIHLYNRLYKYYSVWPKQINYVYSIALTSFYKTYFKLKEECQVLYINLLYLLKIEIV